MKRTSLLSSFLALVPLVLAGPGLAGGTPCAPEWFPTFGPRPGVNDTVHAMTAYDDGSGAVLYVGGEFTYAGGEAADAVARWDGESWSALGAGLGGVVRALAVFDAGSGPELHAGGSFPGHLKKWDGTSWVLVGGGVSDVVWALTVFDDGAGPALYAGGEFASAGGVPSSGIARWDGSAWSSVNGGTNLAVYALAVHDDGGGPALYAGGRFTSAGGIAASRVARWDGASWSALGTGVDDDVRALASFAPGGVPSLVAGGEFGLAGGASAAHVARWDGSTWSPLGSGVTGSSPTVFTLSVHDDGAGLALFAGGDFTTAGGVTSPSVARWDGASWSSLSDLGLVIPAVHASTVLDDGNGPTLIVGGTIPFIIKGSTVVDLDNVGRWDGAGWTPLGRGASDEIRALLEFDDGSAPALYAGGYFHSIGGMAAARVARWDGTSWSALGAGMNNYVAAFAGVDHGSGPVLYAGGAFTTADGAPAQHIASWDGSTWSPLGSGTNGNVHSLASFDDGSGAALYVGGMFSTAGGMLTWLIARWDGVTWSAVGGGLGTSGSVIALEVFDDGTGPALYAAGSFTIANGAPADRIARWDGVTWSAVGGGLGTLGSALAMEVFDDGTGPALHVGGTFSAGFGAPGDSIAKWDGVTWSWAGAGFTSILREVRALAAFGSDLYVGGRFLDAGGVPARSIAKWDGASWSAVGTGLFVHGVSTPNTYALAASTVGGAASLYVGGFFHDAGGAGDAFLARWGCPEPEPTAFCFGTAEDCPCGNGGAPGRGCDNAQGTGGVELVLVAQTTSPNGTTVTGSGFSTMGSPTALVFRSAGLAATPSPFGDGLGCLAPAGVVRLAATTAVAGTSTHAFGHGAMAGGGEFYYQIWYRNTPSAYCTPAAFNLSNGLRISWP